MQNGQIKGAGSLEEGPRVNRDSRSLPRQISSTNTIEQQCVKYWHQGNKRAKRAPSAYLSQPAQKQVPPPTEILFLVRPCYARSTISYPPSNPTPREQTERAGSIVSFRSFFENFWISVAGFENPWDSFAFGQSLREILI